MTFSGICLITNDVCRLSEFYQTVLQTTSDCDDNIHQEIHTLGASLALLKSENEESQYSGGQKDHPHPKEHGVCRGPDGREMRLR